MPPNTLSTSVKSQVNSVNLKRKDDQVKKILYDGQFYDVTDWIKRHPGGTIIDYYTESGEDSTLAIQQFHHRSQEKVMGVMKRLQIIGPASAEHENSTEEERKRLKRHEDLTRDFNKLKSEAEAEGLFEPSLVHLILRILDISIMAGLGLYLIKSVRTDLFRFVGIILFSIALGKCGWLQHEGGHRSLTGVKKVDEFIQALAFGLAKGLSSCWWRSQHNRHHAMPQRLHRDVDLDTLPILAFNTKVLKGNSRMGKKWTNNFFILNQAVLFLTVDTLLVGWYWKLYLHPRYALKKKNYLDIIFMILNYYMVYYLGFWDYIYSSWGLSIYLFGNFSLSHTHLPVTEQQLHWVEYSLLHTQDIEISWCPWLCDWFMGYLNHQVEHHLFPSMPQFRNRQIRDRVKKLGAKYGIPYQSTSYWEALCRTFKNLHNVSSQLETN